MMGLIAGKPIDGSLDAIKKLSEKWNIIIYTVLHKSRHDRPLVNEKDGVELVWGGEI